MTQRITCDPTLSDLVLNAARAAIPADAAEQFGVSHASLKNDPNLLLLLALLDGSRAVASAVADNAWDDCHPVPVDIVKALQEIATRIGSELDTASKSPDRSCWETAKCPA